MLRTVLKQLLPIDSGFIYSPEQVWNPRRVMQRSVSLETRTMRGPILLGGVDFERLSACFGGYGALRPRFT